MTHKSKDNSGNGNSPKSSFKETVLAFIEEQRQFNQMVLEMFKKHK